MASSNITGTYPLSAWHSLIGRGSRKDESPLSGRASLALGTLARHRVGSTSKSEAPTLEFRSSEPVRIFDGCCAACICSSL